MSIEAEEEKKIGFNFALGTTITKEEYQKNAYPSPITSPLITFSMIGAALAHMAGNISRGRPAAAGW